MKVKRLLAIGLTVPFSVASALVMGMATPLAAIGLNPVAIDCGDNAPIHAHVSEHSLGADADHFDQHRPLHIDGRPEPVPRLPRAGDRLLKTRLG